MLELKEKPRLFVMYIYKGDVHLNSKENSYSDAVIHSFCQELKFPLAGILEKTSWSHYREILSIKDCQMLLLKTERINAENVKA